jgi:predicted  nucleic acid-binding Zn ribbon protein
MTQIQQQSQLEFNPELPYAGTSGFSGSDTSRQRTVTADRNGTTKNRQFQTLRYLQEAGSTGLTWKELAELTDLHHGSASGVLSVLHLAKRIERLSLTRSRSKVYVLPEYVLGRNVEKRKQKCCPHCGGNL